MLENNEQCRQSLFPLPVLRVECFTKIKSKTKQFGKNETFTNTFEPDQSSSMFRFQVVYTVTNTTISFSRHSYTLSFTQRNLRERKKKTKRCFLWCLIILFAQCNAITMACNSQQKRKITTTTTKCMKTNSIYLK